MIGAAISGLILWAIIRIFFKHEGNDDIYKILFICLGASTLSLAAYFLIGELAAYIDIPIIVICLINYCGFNLIPALKVVGIYLLLTVSIPVTYDELTSEPSDDTIEIRMPNRETIELKLNEQSNSTKE